MNAAELRLFYSPEERLRLTIQDDKSFLTVKPVWVAPLSRPDTYLALLDGNDKEIVLLPDPNQLPYDSLAALRRELHRRYLTATVQAVHSAREEYGATYWSVETDRGARDFVTQNLQENALWFSEQHLLLLDVDGNRFEILDIEALDPRSRSIVRGIV